MRVELLKVSLLSKLDFLSRLIYIYDGLPFDDRPYQ